MRRLSLAMLVLLSVLAGCSGRAGSAFVVNLPDWPYTDYERIAVLPGQATDPMGLPHAGVLSDRLTTLLTQNGQFTVLSRAELREVMEEQDLSRLADAVDQGTVLPEGRIEVAQALVVPKVTDVRLIADREQRVIPRFGVDRRGRPIQIGQDTIWVYRHGAEVEASVRVVDAATGAILVSHTARVVPEPRTEVNRAPSMTPEEVAEVATNELALEFFRQIAPTRVLVEFEKDNVLVAMGYFDGRYDEVRRLSRAEAAFLVVVRDLDEACDGNRFMVAVAEHEGRANLFESPEFVWSPGAGPRGVPFEVPVSILTDSGGEEFVAKLYSVGNPEPVVERRFELEREKDR